MKPIVTEAMIDRGVAFALQVKIDGDYGWSEYVRDLYLRMQSASPHAVDMPLPHPTEAMIEAAEEAYMPFGDMGFALMAAYAAAPQAPAAPSHWAVINPGLADQYRAEAKMARSCLGFDPDADDVSPSDIRDAIKAPAAPDVAGLVEALKEARRELDSCQRVIHYAGGFDPAYVDGAQKALCTIDAALATHQKREGV